MPKKSTHDGEMTRKARILVVDDDKITRRALEMILKSEFDVTALDSGTRALENILNGADYDVVSTDLNMPGISGVETLKGIKEHNPSIEVLLVTAFQDIESAKQALKLGAYDYLEKPINKEAYRESIWQGVRRRKEALETKKAGEQLKMVKAQLVQSEKLSAIGELLAGVVHEIKNPLTAILGYSELLLFQQTSPEKIQKYAKNIQQSAMLCQKVTQKLLGFARKQEPKKENVHLKDVVESTIELVKHEMKVSGVTLFNHLEEMPYVFADFYQIQQVLLNIINNGVQAMKNMNMQSSLTIESNVDDKFVRISIADNGPGIPDENLQKIFEPFFTTKEEGKGTGLGLSICYDIIQDHGGDIYVSSEPGKGSRFIIELPVADRTKSS